MTPTPIYNDLMAERDPDLHRFCDHTPDGWVQYDPYPIRCGDQDSVWHPALVPDDAFRALMEGAGL